MQNNNSQHDEAHKHRLQMDIILKDAEYKKNEQKKTNSEVEIRQIKRKLQLLETELMAKEQEMKRIDSDQVLLLNEIKKLKRNVANI